MVKYIDLDLQSLVDTLVAYVKEYDRMLSSGVFTREEFAQCKQSLAELHAAIIRKAEEDGCPFQNIYPNFPTPVDDTYEISN